MSPVWIQYEFCICLVEDALVYLPRDPFFTCWVHTWGAKTLAPKDIRASLGSHWQLDDILGRLHTLDKL